jgi:6-phosphofructokinase 2
VRPPVKPIVTLTLNPSIDGASDAGHIRPTRKIRTTNQRFDPDGGGINVARVVSELGGPARAVYLAGGATGDVLGDLLARRGLATDPVPIAGDTRISQAIFETGSGLEYRFVPEGPEVTEAEWAACRETVEALDFDYLVASGSLPRGLGPEAYAGLARLCRARGAGLVLDTSGPALAATLAAGGVFLAKPSLGEFQALVGRRLEDPDEIGGAALARIHGGQAEMLAVTLGHRGALLATASGSRLLRPPPVAAKSATGAGDSFLGGFVLGLAQGRAPEDAFGLATAAGAAAVLTPGTELCRRDDVLRLFGAFAT